MTLAARAVSKSFGLVRALDDVSAEFLPGEIHAVLGENGAGKSTLMNVLSGAIKPDSGHVELAAGASIGMVHQHFMLVPEFSVAENLMLATPHRTPRLNRAFEVEKPLNVARELGWELDPGARTGDLPVGVQQRLEIVKVLATGADVLIFDEPTAVLSPDEVEDLFRVLRDLKAQGRTILLIAHKLAEVLAIADRVTVLRKGRFVATAPREGLDATQLATWMVGELPPELAAPKPIDAPAALLVSNLLVKGDRGETAVDGLSFDVRKGEILGIGGVDGNGQVELAEALAGVRESQGSVELKESGLVAYIPQDRHRDGLALSMSILDNFLIEARRQPGFQKGLLLDLHALKDWADRLVDECQIKLGSLSDPIRSLSGGNQQKVVVSRSLDHRPALVVAMNPSRGLDVRATFDVHQALNRMAQQGVPVVLISTDLDELAALAHRTVYLSRGRLSADSSAESLVGGSA